MLMCTYITIVRIDRKGNGVRIGVNGWGCAKRRLNLPKVRDIVAIAIPLAELSHSESLRECSYRYTYV